MPSIRIARSATAVRGESGRESRLLAGWRHLDAFVLLGDPGAGKSWAFEDECKAVDGVSLSARNVVSGIAPADIHDRIVFIDGLDEVRAGATNGRAPFDAIRKWLLDHGRPRFRLSCREADWLGSNDKSHLEQVAPNGQVEVLHLDPLERHEIKAILASRATEVPDVEQFLQRAQRAGLDDLLRNPLLLDLIVKATAGDEWPQTRAAIYEAACRQLASDVNEEHQALRPVPAGGIERLLHDAGLLFAVQLLSGRRGITLRGTASQDDVALEELPPALKLHDQAAALRSKVFSTEANIAAPRHRSIAEFLAAKALAQCISEGLPLGRVLALMQGFDGRPVEPLRGLWAWLAVHHMPGRNLLIARDPLGFVLNADAATLTITERVDVLRALRDAAEKDPWFRNQAWADHPFGPLATADMASTYEALLRDPQRGRGHEAFIDCVFDALRHGQPMPSLAPALEAWVEDGGVDSHLRVAAYESWKTCVGFAPPKALGWLQAIRGGKLQDADDGLTGVLLHDLYPRHVGPSSVFLHLRMAENYRGFWDKALWQQTPADKFAELAEGWLNCAPAFTNADAPDYDVARLRSKLLAAVLTNSGDRASDLELYRWLGIGLDNYGSSRLENDESAAVRQWLADRPQRMKAVVALGYAKTHADEQGHWPFWQAEQRLHHAALPRDWQHWLLAQATTASTPELAAYCFFPPAHAALEPVTGFDSPSMEEIESWVDEHKAHWPQAVRWLEDAWSMPLDHWQAKNGKRRRQAESQHAASQAKRKQSLQTHWPSLLNGTAAPGLLYHLAVAHEHGFIDIRGDTPLQRVRNYLVSDEASAQAAIDALPLVLARDDLPTVDEAIALEAKGKQHYIRPAALLGARLAFERDSSIAMTWPDALAQRLVAYYLSDGTGEVAGWYRVLAQERPALVASILVQYVLAKLKPKPKQAQAQAQAITGLWALSKEPDHAALARLALPDLLDGFPLRASEAALGTLNRSLLPALAVLDDVQAAAIVCMKLRQTGMSAAQRLAWLVADLPYRAQAVDDLAALVGHNERRAVLLGAALYEQGTLNRVMEPLKPQSVQKLIEVLAPITAPESWRRAGIVTVAHHRGDTVRALFTALSSNQSADARDALVHLEKAPGLGAWSDMLRYSLRTQHTTAREAGFRAAQPQQVAATLANEAPANVADLQALVKWHLDDLQTAWRETDTFALKDFWQDKGRTSKPENDCRDLLLDRLRERLKPLGILVSRERTAAQDKRADQCAEFIRDGRRIALPIEVKKANNDKLWTAWRDQLQHHYMNDPDANEHGLYLVLWFGQRVTTHPEGLKAQSAAQLQALIEQRVPMKVRYRLAVQVLDLSWPG